MLKGLSVDSHAICHGTVPAACYDDRVLLDQSWGYSTPHFDLDAGTRALSYRNRLTTSLVGDNLINFFLSGDLVLEAWRGNNAVFKPQSYAGGVSYFYSPAASAGLRLGITYPNLQPRYVHTAHESMAFIAQSPTLPVGAESRTIGSVDRSVNLNHADYAFSVHHSAEYEFTTQQTKRFYNRILEEFDLPFIP